MVNQANRHRKGITYQVGDMVFLEKRNIKSTRPCAKLNNKKYGPFRVTKLVRSSYRLELPTSMKIHNIFHSDLLTAAPTNRLPGQVLPSPDRIVIDSQDDYSLEDILASKLVGNRLKYRYKWEGIDENLEWYNADNNEFENAQNLVEDFHSRHPEAPRFPKQTNRRRNT